MKSLDTTTPWNKDNRTEGAMLQGPVGCIDQRVESIEIDACRDLWLAVLEQAVKDARGTRRYHSIVQEAREWFRSEDEDPGSFLWVCRILRLDPDAVRDAVEKDYYPAAA